MSDSLTIDVDAEELLHLLDKLGPEAEELLAAVSLDTAQRIDDGATARVARAEGKTASNIVGVDHLPEWMGGGQSSNKTAAFVYVRALDRPDNLGLWLEFGTEHMVARPFLFEAARLEEGPHLRRVEDAVQAAIDKVSP